MSYFENKCPNCGATVISGDAYCRTCNTPLEFEPIPEEAMLYGVKKSDWHMFIDKNSSRYVELFSKNEDKKIFLHMNWSAMFFNFYWMFYRKMHKYAFIFLLINTVFSICLTTILTTAIKPDLVEARKIIEPYNQYLEESNGFNVAYSDGSVDVTEILDASSKYDKAVDSILAKMSFWAIIPSIIFNLLFGLLADCIYRSYILKNIQYKRGGTSGWSLAVGVAIYLLVNNVVLSPIVTYMATKILQ